MNEIRVFHDFDDPFLRSQWDTLAASAGVFPQSTYHWCATWWHYLGQEVDPYIVTVMEYGRIVGLSPLALVFQSGMKILRGIPINYCDFYTFIVEPGEQAPIIRQTLIDYLMQFKSWSAVMLPQVNSEDELSKTLQNSGFQHKKMVDCIIANLSDSDWSEYQKGISRNLRRDVKKKRGHLEREFNITLNVLFSSRAYQDNFDTLIELYESRWADDYRPARSKVYHECLWESVSECFRRKNMVLYLLKADGRIISYRLGFLKGSTFYDWNTSYDVEFNRYSPGKLILSYIIEDLLSRNFTTINYMAGYYDYKLRWSPDRRITSNSLYLTVKPGIRGAVFSLYHLIWRDQLKTFYHMLLNMYIARWISRKIFSWLKR